MTTEADFEAKRCKTAEEFLDYLQLRNKQWLTDDQWSSPWVFRGHQNESWKLLPRIWRENDDATNELLKSFLKLVNNEFSFTSQCQQIFDEIYTDGWDSFLQMFNGFISKNRVLRILKWTAVEVEAIYEFMEEADKSGFRIPEPTTFGHWEDVLSRYAYFQSKSNEIIPIWDGRNHYIVALAQHHGIPTALLDWTRNPFYAALFAAEKVQHEDKGYHIAVWALDSRILAEVNLYSKSKDYRLQKITIPLNENLYLRSQNSLFTYDKLADYDYIVSVKRPTLDEVLVKTKGLAEAKKYLQKITLPVEQVGELLRLLTVEGITKARLMPTYDNVTDVLKMRWRWL